MSVTFSTGFHLLKPGYRVAGDQITAVVRGTYTSGLYSGQKFLHIDLAEKDDLIFGEEGIAGPLETLADVDATYTQLKDAGMVELFDGMLVDISDISRIEVSAEEVLFDFRGHAPYIFKRNPDPAAVEIDKLASQTWMLPQASFDGAATSLQAADGSEEIELVSIENRLGLLEATNGLIKQDYNYITLVGTPAPDPGQVGVDSATPSQVSMIVLPKTDADGKTLTFDQFVLGDRMGLKQSNGSAALYELDPALDTGDHIRFNATLLALGYYADKDFVFNAAVTAVIEDNSARTSAAGVMGVSESAADLGTFSGATIADGSNIKAALQSLETSGETTIASLANEASVREAADTALDGRVAALEADPTTAAAVAAGDAATLSSANTYTDTSITNLVNGADAALDTLKEIGDALAQGDSDVTAALTAQITTESTTRAAADAALSGRLDTLEADPTTQSALDAEVTARTTADSALDGRVTTLEGNAAITDPTTATAVAAVQSDVDANQTASESADAALSGRLDVLEADPTTQTAVDAKLDASAVSAYGLTLVDDADAATARTTLGLGTAATTAASDYATAAQGALADTAVQPAAISNIDNTSDADKPVSTAQQAALDLRALLDGTNIPGPYADDTAAASGGVAVGALYKHNNGQIHYRVS